jgi:hypothetical protein
MCCGQVRGQACPGSQSDASATRRTKFVSAWSRSGHLPASSAAAATILTVTRATWRQNRSDVTIAVRLTYVPDQFGTRVQPMHEMFAGAATMMDGDARGNDHVSGNFDFIKAEWPQIHAYSARAEGYLASDLRSACFYARRAAERLVGQVYTVEGLLMPYKDDLAARVNRAGAVRGEDQARHRLFLTSPTSWARAPSSTSLA